MRNLKKFLTTLITLCAIVATVCVSASAATTKFTDVSAKDKQLTEAVSLLSYLNVAKGTSDTTFGTTQNVTRQQMAAFIYRLVKSGQSLEGGVNQTKFVDLRDSTYFSYVSWANHTGVIKGRSETIFDPLGTIILQDAYTMIIRALGYDTEDANLEYPYDFIDLAESEEINLCEGLPSNVNYDTPLTRGNVAILLYNAFFAETNFTKTVQVERTVGLGTPHQKQVLEKKTIQPTVAEHFYEVIEGNFTVKATPHFAFNSSPDSTEYKPLISNFDNDALHFVATDEDEAIDEFFVEFSELNLSGEADDYIMAGFDVFYKLDEKKEKIEKIFYADGAVIKKSSTDATLNKITPKRSSDYFGGDTSYPLLDGSIKVGSETLWFFDAPYTYLKPNYGSETDPDITYLLRNEKNVKLIGYKLINEADGTYGYYVRDDIETGDPTELALALNQIYTRGIYNVDIYDVDGDGIFEYMRYMPATFGQANGDEGYEFDSVEEHSSNTPVYVDNDDSNTLAHPTIPTIYYNGANFTGARFNEEDFIFAYLNTEANEIHVFDVATTTQGTLSHINTATSTIKVNGMDFRTCYAYIYVKGFNMQGGADRETVTMSTGSGQQGTFPSLWGASALDEDFIIYSYNKNQNNVYFYVPLTAAGATYDEKNLIIPLADEDGRRGVTSKQFNSKTSQTDHYLKVWVDGAEKYVPVVVNDIYPEPKVTADGYDFGVTVKEYDGVTYPAYLGKLCTYTKDKYGRYIITSLLHNRDENGEFDGINNDASTLVEDKNSEQFGHDWGYEQEAKIVKITSSRYELVDPLGYSLLGDDQVQNIDQFVMTDTTKIIIRNYITSEDEYEYLTFDKTSFGGTTETPLYNVQYILQGDPNSKVRADMVLLYAEAEDFEFETKTSSKDWRIVKEVYPVVDADGYYSNNYVLYDPFTGKESEDVAGSKRYPNADDLDENRPFENAGKFVKLTTDGKVDETETDFDQIALSGDDANAKLVFVTDFSASDKVVEIQPVRAEDEDEFLLDATSGAFLYALDDESVVTMMTNDSTTKLANGEMTLIDAEDLADPKNEMLCYNDKMQKEGTDKYHTEYAEFVKAYISFREPEGDEELPIIDFMIVVVHPDEAEDFLAD